MTKRMLIDATHAEETRVAVVDGNRLVDFDYESKHRRQLKGSIFLAKVTRVEPSLQAAFVNFGGNRHGFLPFSEIHPDYFRIPISDREALLAEQREEMEARRRAEEEEDLEEDAARAAGTTADGEAEDEDDAVEEVGGENRVVAEEEETGEDHLDDFPSDDEEEEPLLPVTVEEPEDETVEMSPGEEESEDDEQPEEDFSDEDDSEDAEEIAEEDGEDSIGNRLPSDEDDVDDNIGNLKTDDVPDANGNEQGGEGRNGRGRRGRGGRDRFRGRSGRGGGRNGGRRMASNSRRVEMVGGDIEGEHPVRPSLRRNYKIQEVVKRGQIMLIQVSKEERGNKGAAVTTYLSLPGRYCVLMPNSPRGGGVSRKIASYEERKRMRELLSDLEVPEGMSVIMRTAGVQRNKTEIKRDFDYLLKLWNGIRDLTLQSSAPAQIHEEGTLIRRTIRDIYSRDIEEIVVSGEEGFKMARDFMRILMPSHIKRVKQYRDETIPLFHRYQVESQIAAMGEPTVTLKSGGYLVINPTEALVSIDVNSGKATKERHIEETALKTNLEAADEVARQLRLRDLGGLVVIDFIDMEDRRNNAKVERRLKEALSSDRARIQVGRISMFGLMELSRQRLNPSLTEAQFQKCAHCEGVGYVRTIDSAAITAMRALEEEGIRGRSVEVILHLPNEVAIYILNNKRGMLDDIERRYGFRIMIRIDESLAPDNHRIDLVRGSPVMAVSANHVSGDGTVASEDSADDEIVEEDGGEEEGSESGDNGEDREGRDRQDRSRRRGRRGGRNRRDRDDRPHQGRERPERVAGGDDSSVITEGGFAESFDEGSDAVGEGTESGEGQREGRGDRGRRGRYGRGRSRRGGRDRDDRSPQFDSGSESAERAASSPRPEDNRADYAPVPANEAPASVPVRSGDSSGVTIVSRPAAVRAVSSEAAPRPKDYEVVNAAPTEKKKGWWNRLVEN
ncbi:MAG: Rne/Rng family ribonuclease [Micavibrio aeruginosavorus]|uniref:Ribonuclease G n=1 Tax=Micavibrio aeruginosavorus TaxID=349221 RepID=A0A7T5R381_9BACT|nr:MAG: Rne/Rng family ribonuclease [Micavibrio aeruginosavorus]